MTLEEIDGVLPNGFHDAWISEFTQDYVNASLRLKISVVIGLPTEAPADANRRRKGEILFKDVLFCSIETPDSESAFRTPSVLWFRVYRTEPGQLPETLRKSIRPEVLCYSLFILDWLSHIHVAALDVDFIWCDAEEVRHPI